MGATAEEFVTDNTGLPEGVSIVDMETAPVALLAKEYGVPFLAFRTTSDVVADVGTDATFLDAARASAKVTVQYILEE